jgi:hypothetical protein
MVKEKILALLSPLLIVVSFLYFFLKAYLAYIEPMSASAEDWVSLHQVFYTAALFMALMAWASNINLAISGLISLVLATLAYEFLIFDGAVHSFFISSGFYQALGAPNFAGNSQYSKLMFYGFFILTFGILLIVPRFRSMSRLFVFILLLVNLAVIFLNHVVLPSGLLKEIASSEVKLMDSVASLNQADFQKTCQIHNWNCRLKQGAEIQEVFSAGVYNEKLKPYFQRTQLLLEQSAQNISITDTNTNPSIYKIVKSENSDTFYEIFEHEKVYRFWKLSLGYLSFFCFAISMSWFYAVIGLSFIHKKVRLNSKN